MKYYIQSKEVLIPEENQLHVTIYLQPIFYEDSAIFATVTTITKGREYHTDVNPRRILNGPLSGPGEELGSPLADEWDSFLDDCKFLIEEIGFTIISMERSDTSKKSEYFIVFGLKDRPCGYLVFDLRVSDHPFDATFPEEAKAEVLEYLKINKILTDEAARAGIDFKVESVLVGNVKNDSWDSAFKRLFLKLRGMKRQVNTLLKVRGLSN